MHSPILGPVVALVAWSLVMLVWMFLVRMPALKRAGVDMSKARGGRPGILDGMVEERAQWPAHNYIHLMEQPTLFYAIALTLALMGQGDGINAWIAWGYVGLRIAHSLVQATINKVAIRFGLFVLSTVALIALTLHAGIALLH
ncbi:MAPEG family protein [Sphingomonas sp. HF-S4]|uniref:MAPEG family protein n=1 Tax=Sphingomonas agrestis TaxID=3080540 RepID=A0ABU3Y7G0_9SPHN|nr:MAPEG family protein [Sphingomonas sp. HF-S4]MDV3457047.1 MAPEG family protein [Sphingomonas sp. HF-S4]